jgi:hypothetical protein
LSRRGRPAAAGLRGCGSIAPAGLAAIAHALRSGGCVTFTIYVHPDRQEKPKMWKRLGDIWCILMHEKPMWPIHGRYECSICGRQHQVPWAGPQSGHHREFHQQEKNVPALARPTRFRGTTGEQSCGWRTC